MILAGRVAIPLGAVVATLLTCRHDNPSHVGGLGLISVTPWPVFLIGSVLSLSFVLVLRRPGSDTGALAAHVGAFAFLVHGVAALLEVHARFPVAYLHTGITQVIINHRHPLPALDSRFSWPGFFTAAAAVVGMAHLGSALPLIRWTPLAFNLSYLLPVFVIARSLLRSRRRAWVVVWLFLLTNWVGQDYFSPQGLGYFLFLAVLATVITVFPQTGSHDLRGRLGALYERVFDTPDERALPSTGQSLGLLAILTASAIALSMEHQLTPVVLAVDLCVLALARLTSARWYAVICVVATIAWISYGAVGFWSGHLSLLFGSGGSSAVKANVGGHFTGDTSHRLVVDERIVFSLVVWLTAACATVWAVLRHRRVDLTAVLLALAPFPIVLAQAYGGEASLRLYLFTLPFMLILIVGALPRVVARRRRRRGFLLLAAISAAAVPAFLIACYGNEQFEQATTSDLQAAQYVYSVARPGATLGLVVDNAFLSYTRFAQYRYADVDQVVESFRLVTPTRLEKIVGGNPRGSYLLITPAQREFAIVTYGFPEDWVAVLTARLSRDASFRLVYDRDGSFIYRLGAAGGKAGSQR